MDVFLSLSAELLPLYFLIFLGFVAGRWLGVDKKSIATLSIYAVTPFVIMYGVAKSPISPSFVALPIIMFILCSLICRGFYFVGKRAEPEMAGILGFASASGNTGYFGLPVAVMIFGEDILGLAAVVVLGNACFENSVGVYTVASGRLAPMAALKKLLSLPPLYGFVVGLAINLFNIPLSESVETMLGRFVGAYTVLGMMIIGLGLAELKRASFDKRFIALTSAAHFVVWPLLTGAVIALDALTFQALHEQARAVLLFMSIVPIAANSVAWATVFDFKPDRVALSVLITTLFALVYIPIFLGLFVL